MNTDIERLVLKNGLNILVHKDDSTTLACMNIIYNVGSKHEDQDKTGFAHLFEHLMFGGSRNIPDYDGPVQRAGGENNAFTCSDYTDYYCTVPGGNLETLFWLESDRMNELNFSQQSLEIQQNVVVEEFKQRYLNQPYGDVWMLLNPLAYTVHPYQWPTIGKDISHIRDATLQDVKDFFYRYYRPANAIVTITGRVDPEKVFALSEKWFGDIPGGSSNEWKAPVEPIQLTERRLSVEKNVPADAIYMAFHCVSRLHPAFFATDFLSDVLGLGTSSRLYASLVKEKQIFTEIHSYLTDQIDCNLFVISGKIAPAFSIEQGEEAIWEELNRIKIEVVTRRELEKIKNHAETAKKFSKVNILNQAMGMSYFELIGDIERYDSEIEKFMAVTTDEITAMATDLFKNESCSVLLYRSSQK
jgi:zinc protease